MLDQPPTNETPVSHYPPIVPPSVGGRAAPGSREDVLRQSPTTALSRVAALSRLLVSREPAEVLVVEALRQGAELLPGASRLALFAVGEAIQAPLTEVAYASRSAPGAAVVAETANRPAQTLGLGSQVDRHVLEDGQTLRTDGMRCQPLRGAHGRLLGVLVVGGAKSELAPVAGDGLAILCDHVTLLLERWERERSSERFQSAVAGLLPRARAALGPVTAATASREERLLRSLALSLREMPGVLGSVALMVRDGGRLSALTNRRENVDLTSAQSRRILGAIAANTHEHLAALTGESAAWGAFAPVLALVEGKQGPSPARVLILPVRAERTRFAYVLLALGAAVSDTSWLTVARVLCLAAGERIQAGRAEAAHEAQGRAYDAFLSLMAHELRSPLTSVKGYAQLLIRQARRNALPEGVMRSTEAIEQQAGRLSEMIDELHDAARIRRKRLELLAAPVDLAPIVSQQVERWRRLSPEHEYRLTTADEPLIGEWDAHRLTQVVRDLLDNATRYSPTGGVIEVELSRVGDEALLVVRDAGIGIAPADRDRIFDYLYRAPDAENRNLGGLGLGLFVSRTIAEKMGGRLWLSETRTGEDSGSEFRLALPLLQG